MGTISIHIVPVERYNNVQQHFHRDKSLKTQTQTYTKKEIQG